MSAVGTGVLAKLQRRLPNQIGTNRQWSTSYIQSLILAAAHAAEERIGMTWTSSDIALSNNVGEYAVPSKFIEVVTVEFALNGTTFNRELTARTFDDLDEISIKWKDDIGQYPSSYALLSTPGLQYPVTAGANAGARIFIHSKPSVAAGSKIRVSGYGIGTLSTNIVEDVQERVLVPYVMAIIRAEHDVREATMHYDSFRSACNEIQGRFGSPYPEQPARMGGGS